MTFPWPDDVSIIIPTWESALFILSTLHTVASQTVRGFELIISDDGSSDETVKVVEDFLAPHPELHGRVVRNPHVGPGAARNAGLRAATRPWVAFLDSDDAWLPGKLERTLAALRANPEANAACHAEWHQLEDGSRRLLDYGESYDASVPLAEQLYARNLFSTSAMVIRRDLALKAGGFDATLQSSQDYELWLRLSPELRPVFVREPLGVYLDRPGNISSRKYLRRVRNHFMILWRHREKIGTLRALRIIGAKVARKMRDRFGVSKGLIVE